MTDSPTDFPETSFFADHVARTKAIVATYPILTVAKDTPDYMQPFIDYSRLRWMIPSRECERLDYQWGLFCEATIGYRLPNWQWRGVANYKPSDDDAERYTHWFEWTIGAWGGHEARSFREPAEQVNLGGTPPEPWPDGAYSVLHGYNAGYEAWLGTLSDEARVAEVTAVFDRFRAEYTLFAKGILYFQILWPSLADPQLVTPANWNDEGMEIAQRYNHRAPAKEHWLLSIDEVFAIYNPTPAMISEGVRLNCSTDKATRDGSNHRPVNRLTSKGGKPADPE